MSASNPECPKRLSEGTDPAAELITRALAEVASGPSEQQSWLKLEQRSARVAPRWALPALAFGFALCALFLLLERPSAESSLRPDVWSHPALPLPLPRRVPGSLPSAARAEPAPEPERVKALAHASAASSAAAEGDATRCAKLAKDVQYADAVACYGRVARGSGMVAELALYEKARLEAKGMGQRSQALATLDEHSRRFPGGVLASEVGLTRIELLSQLGQRAQALSAIERGLQGALGRERRGDLQVMRADLLAAGGDCAAALEAVSQARQAGVHPSRLAASERRCALGTSPASAPNSSASATPFPAAPAPHVGVP
jgi:hypothetical protein